VRIRISFSGYRPSPKDAVRPEPDATAPIAFLAGLSGVLVDVTPYPVELPPYRLPAAPLPAGVPAAPLSLLPPLCPLLLSTLGDMVPQLDGIVPRPPSLEGAPLRDVGKVAAACAKAERATVDAAPADYPTSIRDRARGVLEWMAGLMFSPDGELLHPPSLAAFLAATFRGGGKQDNKLGPLSAAWRQCALSSTSPGRGGIRGRRSSRRTTRSCSRSRRCKK